MSTVFIYHPFMVVRRLRVISKEQTAKIIELAEAHANVSGWTTKRHDHYATTDIPVSSTNELYHYLRDSGLQQQIRDTIATAYGVRKPAKWGLLDLDSFVVKYAVSCDPDKDKGCGQADLGIHTDGSEQTVVSYNILLNEDSDFEGGGTILEMFDRQAAPLSNGMAVTHASKLRHGGATITKGTRYILVGFMQFESALTPLKHYVQSLSDILSVQSPEVVEFMERLGDEWLPHLLVFMVVVVVASVSIVARTIYNNKQVKAANERNYRAYVERQRQAARDRLAKERVNKLDYKKKVTD